MNEKIGHSGHCYSHAGGSKFYPYPNILIFHIWFPPNPGTIKRQAKLDWKFQHPFHSGAMSLDWPKYKIFSSFRTITYVPFGQINWNLYTRWVFIEGQTRLDLGLKPFFFSFQSYAPWKYHFLGRVLLLIGSEPEEVHFCFFAFGRSSVSLLPLPFK